MKSSKRLTIGLSAIAVLGFTSCTSSLGGNWTPSDINENGVAVGQRLDGDHGAVVYEHDTLVSLPGLPGASGTNAVSIADDGTIFGTSNATIVSWDNARAIHDLGRPNGGGSANAANNRGVIVGTTSEYVPARGSYVVHAWVRDPATAQFIDLPTLPGAYDTEPFAINDNGDIAGSVAVEDASFQFLGVQAVKWAAGTRELQVLPVPAGLSCSSRCQSYGRGINSSGTVVGYSENQPVLWPVGGNPVVLPVGTHRGGRAYAINDAGTVVGIADDSNFEWVITTAARWNADRKLELLYTPEPTQIVNGLPRYDNSEALAINNAGVAVGPTSKGAMLFR